MPNPIKQCRENNAGEGKSPPEVYTDIFLLIFFIKLLGPCGDGNININ